MPQPTTRALGLVRSRGCAALGNYNGMFEVVTGLKQPDIFCGKANRKAWDRAGKGKTRRLFEELDALTSGARNHAVYVRRTP